MQTYSPLRSELLDREELRLLSSLEPLRVIWGTLLSWVLIFSAWLTFIAVDNYTLYPFVVAVVGLAFNRLYIIGHDGLHRRLFKSSKLNDLWNDTFVMSFLGASTAHNRKNHMEHHVHTCEESDPDRYKYVSENKNSPFKFIAFYFNLGIIYKSLGNVYGKNVSKTVGKKKNYVPIVILNLLLFFFHYQFIGWWSFFLLWLAPVFLLVYITDLLRVFCEHNMPFDEAEADKRMRLITFVPNLLESWIFSPLNMNYHAEHHLWTAIPYYNLPIAHKLIREKQLYKEHVEVRHSYAGYIWRFLRTQPSRWSY